MCKIINRLKEFIDFKGIPVSAFEKSIGMSNASFGKQLKNQGAIGSDKLENILKIYNDLSPLWLMTGEGTMIKEAQSPTDDSGRVNTKLKVVRRHGQLSYKSDEVETRPRIPFDAAAGSLSMAMEGISDNECELLPIITTLPRYDFTIIARGDSMEPDFLSGDELACAFVNNSRFIQWGRPHVLDTAQGVVLKRIFNDKDDIRCNSINPIYPDFTIPKDEIYHLAIVVGLIRHF